MRAFSLTVGKKKKKKKKKNSRKYPERLGVLHTDKKIETYEKRN